MTLLGALHINRSLRAGVYSSIFAEGTDKFFRAGILYTVQPDEETDRQEDTEYGVGSRANDTFGKRLGSNAYITAAEIYRLVFNLSLLFASCTDPLSISSFFLFFLPLLHLENSHG